MTMLPPELFKGLEKDEEVKKKVRELVLLAVDEAYELLTSGSPTVKQNVMRTLLPAAVKVSQSNDQEEELAKMRADMASLISEVRGNSGSNPPHLSVVDSD